MSVKLASNGFSYAPIESTKVQRKNRIVSEIMTKKALSIEEIRKICGYSTSNGARKLAYDLVSFNPDFFCITPPLEERKSKTEAVKLTL